MVIPASFGTVTLQLHVSCSLYTVLIHDVLPKERTLLMLASRNIVFAWEALNSFVMEVYEASTHPCGVNLSATHPSIHPAFIYPFFHFHSISPFIRAASICPALFLHPPTHLQFFPRFPDFTREIHRYSLGLPLVFLEVDVYPSCFILRCQRDFN